MGGAENEITETETMNSKPFGVRQAPRLGPAERVCARKDFERLRKEGRRGGDSVLRVLVARNGLEISRIASAVPRRYGKAVVRNRMRRHYKEAFRRDKDSLPPGLDILVSPARGALEATLEDVRASLQRCVAKVARRLEQRSPKAGASDERR